jgi:phosphate transport system permease protein
VEDDVLIDEGPPAGPDRRAELTLGALVCVVVGLVLAMFVFVLHEGWPSFAHNGWHWFGAGGNVDDQINAIYTAGNNAARAVYTFHAWPLIWSTIVIVGGAVVIAFVCSLFVAVFIAEFAPAWLRAVLHPVVRLLAMVPSVVYGLLGVVVLVPFINNDLISEQSKASVTPIITLDGYSVLAAVVILAVMIAPLMIAIFVNGLRSVPRGWLEGSLALGINPWRTVWKVGVRTAKPALIAGTVIATARGVGEAVMLSMVSGSVGFAPNPADGFVFIYEPSRPLAATIIDNIDQLTSPPMRHTLYALGAVLLFSAAMLSFAGWAAKQPLLRYGLVS